MWMAAPQELTVHLDDVNQNFQTRDPLRIGGGGGPANRFHGQIDDVRVYNVALSPKHAAVVATGESINEIAAIAAAKRSEPQTEKITLYFLENHAPAPVRQAWKELVEVRSRRSKFVESLPTVMVMQERDTVRDTFLLLRGAYDKPGDKVTPGVPAILPTLPKGEPNNRLGFARWLVDPSNPLTARVAVNRFWQMYFGAGLVKTVEDFGSQGEWPSHPELLDWLATEFVRTGWDVKAMQKLIVTSATYRQSSKATPELLQKDPENRLLARAPRFRLPAEMIRDQALAVSGLLVERIGGPSVKPYQPAGLWKELSGQDYVQDTGEKLYRRSLYTYWKRSSPPPSQMNFDAAGREACVVRESRTNTPLQALDLMNDVTYLEASRKLAERVMKERRASPEERIDLAFRLAVARRPAPREAALLREALSSYLDDLQERSRGGAEVSDPGGIPERRGAGRERAGGLFDARELDPEHGRDDYEGVSMDPRLEHQLRLTRRQFFGVAGGGIGAAALATLLSEDLSGAAAGLQGLPHFAPTAKRVIYLFQSGGPSQMDMFDYKPRLARSARLGTAGLDTDGPAPDRHDLDAGDVSRSRLRCSSLRSTGSPARGSASCCRTRRRSSTICASSSRCIPKPSITIRASRSSRQERSWPEGRASGRGFPTGWEARTTICLRLS